MKVTLGGIHLDVTRQIAWEFTTGTFPYQTIIETDAKEAAILLAKTGEPMKLTIEDKGNLLEVENVFILGEKPATSPFTRAFLISDRRWRWGRKIIKRRYNIRRRTGDKRLLSEGTFVPLEVTQVVDEFFFAPFSVDHGTKWIAKRTIQDVMDEITTTVDPLPYEFRGSFNPSMDINDLELDEPAPGAVSVLLKNIPGTDLYVDKSGKVIIFNTLDGSEAGVVTGAGSPLGDSAFPKTVDLKAIAPIEIDVLFNRRIEVRFDSLSDGDSITEDSRYLENVIPVTDPALTISGKVVAMGTWANVDALLAAFNANKDPGGDGLTRPDIDHTMIRQGFFQNKLYNRFTLSGSDIVDPIWVGRIGALMANYRVNYRLPRRWMDKIHSIKATRVGIMDLTTGTPALARAYADYAVIPAKRGRLLALPNVQKGVMAINHFGYSANLVDGHISPADVVILDEQVGIVHLNYRKDFYGVAATIVPSAVVNAPVYDMSVENRPHTWGERSQDGTVMPALASGHRVAIVFTVTAGAPNGSAQFHKETVKPADVKGLVPNLTPDGAKGPRWELRVGPEILEAWVAWRDADSALVEQAFGINNADPTEPVDLSSLTVNTDMLRDVARAVAAAVWKRFQTRVRGEKEVRLNPAVTITGAINRVIHGVRVDGRAFTNIQMIEETAELNPLALLTQSSRAMVLREVPD